MNKTSQDLKMEIEAVKKTQMDAVLEMENIGKRTGNADASITNSIQDMKEKILDVEDSIEEIDTTVKKKAKCNKFLFQNF